MSKGGRGGGRESGRDRGREGEREGEREGGREGDTPDAELRGDIKGWVTRRYRRHTSDPNPHTR